MVTDQLSKFNLERNSKTGDLRLLVRGSPRYKRIIAGAFPHLWFSTSFAEWRGEFNWGTYIKHATSADAGSIELMCGEFTAAILLRDSLDECFALSFHSQPTECGSYVKTPMGQLVRSAKSYGPDNPGDMTTAKRIAEIMAKFVVSHPTYHKADVVISVPGSNGFKTFDLPGLLVKELCARLGLFNGNSAIGKNKETKPMKDCDTVAEKSENIADAYKVTEDFFQERTVLIIDDIYHTGTSINELGRTISAACASRVLGLTATKTLKDLPDDRRYP